MPLSCHKLLFSADSIFNCYWGGGAAPTSKDISLLLLVTKHGSETQKPDGYHRNALESAFSTWQPQTLSRMVNASLNEIVAEHLFWENSHLYVKLEFFPSWQETIGELPAVPLLAYAIRNKIQETGGDEKDRKILAESVLGNSAQPSLCVPMLDDLIHEGGLHELHMHLSGTTEPDFVWQQSLGSPYRAYHEFRVSHASREAIKEFLLQIGLKNPIDIYHLLRFGALLRDRLAYGVSNIGENADALPICPYRKLVRNPSDARTCRFRAPENREQQQNSICSFTGGSDYCGSFWVKPLTLMGLQNFTSTFRYTYLSQPMLARREGDHPIAVLEPQFSGLPSQIAEAIMLCRAYDAVEKGDEAVAAWLHAYLVVQTRFHHLLVQQRDQVGFDQFQKIPDNKLRDPIERKYAQRFRQLRGMYGRDLASLEGRFSPKPKTSDIGRQVNQILKGYQKAYGLKKDGGLFSNFDAVPRNRGNDQASGIASRSDPPDLKLVAHFIKKPDPGQDPVRPDRHYYLCRHHKLRYEIWRKAMALAHARSFLEDVKNYVVGIDACANEMHAPPEVFAPAFRMLRLRGFPRCTYHAGEDFMHLISGIRAVHETLMFLDLREGDRIGHATALGIDPDIWLKRLPPVRLGMGEWYDNVIFAYKLLRTDPKFTGLCMQLIDEAARLHNRLFASLQQRGMGNKNKRNRGTAPSRRPASELLSPGNNDGRFDMRAAIAAWKLRSTDPLMAFYGRLDEPAPLSVFQRHEWQRAREACEEDPQAFQLFQRYHFIAPQIWNESVEQPENLRRLDKEVYTALQCIVLKEVKRRGVVLESMPSSNVRISYYDSYDEHHITDWLGYGQRDLPCPTVCICTDNPGIFPTTLRNEFCHVFLMITRKLEKSEDEAMTVLRCLNRNARAYRFGLPAKAVNRFSRNPLQT